MEWIIQVHVALTILKSTCTIAFSPLLSKGCILSIFIPQI